MEETRDDVTTSAMLDVTHGSRVAATRAVCGSPPLSKAKGGGGRRPQAKSRRHRQSHPGTQKEETGFETRAATVSTVAVKIFGNLLPLLVPPSHYFNLIPTYVGLSLSRSTTVFRNPSPGNRTHSP